MLKSSDSKKYIILSLLIVIASIFSLYQIFLKDESVSVFEGTIMGLDTTGETATLLVDGRRLNQPEEEGAVTIISYMIDADTRIIADNAESDLDTLAVGNLVKIEGPDVLRTSYPAQADADRVILLREVSTDILIEGELMEISESASDGFTILVRGSVTGYGDTSEVYVRVPEDAYQSHEPDQLFSEGNSVRILIDGPLAESYPMQGTASSIFQIEEN